MRTRGALQGAGRRAHGQGWAHVSGYSPTLEELERSDACAHPAIVRPGDRADAPCAVCAPPSMCPPCPRGARRRIAGCPFHVSASAGCPFHVSASAGCPFHVSASSSPDGSTLAEPGAVALSTLAEPGAG
jgi:hypothetical protein